jgi:hypothetical protein
MLLLQSARSPLAKLIENEMRRGSGRTFALAVAICCVFSQPSRAQQDLVNAAEFFDKYNSADANRRLIYAHELGLIFLGITVANSLLTVKKQPPLYCVPDYLAVTDDQLVTILANDIKSVPKNANASLGLALLFALVRVFPCSH